MKVSCRSLVKCGLPVLAVGGLVVAGVVGGLLLVAKVAAVALALFVLCAAAYALTRCLCRLKGIKNKSDINVERKKKSSLPVGEFDITERQAKDQGDIIVEKSKDYFKNATKDKSLVLKMSIDACGYVSEGEGEGMCEVEIRYPVNEQFAIDSSRLNAAQTKVVQYVFGELSKTRISNSIIGYGVSAY